MVTFLLGQTLAIQRRWHDAIPLLRRVSSSPGPSQGPAQSGLAWCLAVMGDPATAAEVRALLDASRAVPPARVKDACTDAALGLLEGDPERACAKLRALPETEHIDGVTVAALLGEALARLGRREEAEAALVPARAWPHPTELPPLHRAEELLRGSGVPFP